jgi:predicted GNAT family acetyltransferase
MTEAPLPTVRDNAAQNRFELEEAGQTAFADYRRHDGRLIITHVESPPALRGSGAAGRLMTGVLEAARAKGETVTPLCSYAAAFIRRHAEYQDLLA